jgi:hypothetical protein
MELEETLEKVKRLIDSGRSEFFPNAIALFAAFLVQTVTRNSGRGQASFLRVTSPGEEFAFAYPPELVGGNRLPVLDSSIAGRVVIGGRTIVENSVPQQSHFGFYERVPNPRGEVRTIQKMIAAPIPGTDSVPIGVVEVSLTGATPDEAGPDFTEEDGFRLETYCEVFAPFFQKIWAR